MVDVDEIKTISLRGDTHRESHSAVVVEYIEECNAEVKEEETEQRKERVERMGVCVANEDFKGCKTVVESCVDADERRELLNHCKDDFKRSFFCLAIKVGDLPLCKLVVNACRDDDERRMLLNGCGEFNATVLHFAARYRHLEVVKWLLSNDERGGRRLGFNSLMARDRDQKTALHVAAERGHLSCCKALVDGCRNEDERRELLNAVCEHKATVLLYAAACGQEDIIKWLLSNDEGGGRRLGFNSLMVRDKEQKTALHDAAERGHLSCCKALVDGCRNDDERKELLNAVCEHKATVLLYAAAFGQEEVIKWLLSNDEGGGRRLGFDSLMVRDKEQRTALHHAAREGHLLSCCKLILQRCRDDERREMMNAVTKYGRTVLHWAAFQGHLDFIQWLLSDDEGGGRRLGFDSLMRRDSLQRTALHHAAREGLLLTCKALVDGCRNDDQRKELLNAVGGHDWTVLHYASCQGHDNVVQWLLNNDEGGGRRLGFDSLTARDKNQETALHLAARKNHRQACQALLDGCRNGRERIALIQAIDINGQTIVHAASLFRSVDGIKWILQSPEMQFIFNLKDNKGFTALHLMILDRTYQTTPLVDAVTALLFDTEAENQAIIDNDNQKDMKRIATKIDPNIGCGFNWNP